MEILHFILTLCSLWFLPFSVFALSPTNQPPSKPFLSVPISYHFSDSSGPGTSVSVAAPRFKCWEPVLKPSSPSPQLPAVTAPPMACSISLNGFPTTTFRFSHPRRISLFCSQAPQCGEARCQDDSPGQCHSRAQQPRWKSVV